MRATTSIRSICIGIASSLRASGQADSGVLKDVVMLSGYQEVDVDFVTDNPA